MKMWELDLDIVQDWCERTGCVLLRPEEAEKLELIRPKIELYIEGKAEPEILEEVVSILRELQF